MRKGGVFLGSLEDAKEHVLYNEWRFPIQPTTDKEFTTAVDIDIRENYGLKDYSSAKDVISFFEDDTGYAFTTDDLLGQVINPKTGRALPKQVLEYLEIPANIIGDENTMNIIQKPKNTIRVLTSDKKVVELAPNVYMQSEIFKNMFEDADESDEPIPLPNVKFAQLHHLDRFLKGSIPKFKERWVQLFELVSYLSMPNIHKSLIEALSEEDCDTIESVIEYPVVFANDYKENENDANYIRAIYNIYECLSTDCDGSIADCFLSASPMLKYLSAILRKYYVNKPYDFLKMMSTQMVDYQLVNLIHSLIGGERVDLNTVRTAAIAESGSLDELKPFVDTKTRMYSNSAQFALEGAIKGKRLDTINYLLEMYGYHLFDISFGKTLKPNLFKYLVDNGFRFEDIDAYNWRKRGMIERSTSRDIFKLDDRKSAEKILAIMQNNKLDKEFGNRREVSDENTLLNGSVWESP